MKKLKSLLIFTLLPFVLAGCLQVDTTINVNKDGSGTINEKVLFSKTFVNMIKEFAQSFSDSASADQEDLSMFKDDEIKADAKDFGEDVKYVSHKLISNDKWEGYEAVYSFNDVTKIKIKPDPGSKVSIGEEGAEAPSEEDFYFFKFVKGNTPELIIDRPEIKLSGETEENNQEQSEQNDEGMNDEILKMMEGMSVTVSVDVKGKIENTNASYVDGSKITLFEMNFAEMMKNKEAFKEFKNKEPKNIDEMKAFLEKFPGMKIQIDRPVTIKFK
ncbi:MAG: hypothetical protein P8X47_00080 [Ignavibacteriaceae bacterium]